MENKVPRFFKVLVPGFQTKLRLPPLISEKLGEKEPNLVLLTSKKGSWEVNTKKSQDGLLWLTNGWRDFVVQHGLQVGHFLTFKHLGSFHFNVIVFNHTCCENDFKDESERRTQGNLCLPTLGQTDEMDQKNSVPSSPVNIQAEAHKVSAKIEFEEDEAPPPPSEIQKPDKGKMKKDDGAPSKVKNHRKGITESKMIGRGRGRPKGVNKSSSAKRCQQLAVRMKGYNLRTRSPYLHIPVEFCVKTGLIKDTILTLRGPAGKQEVSIKVCNGGNTKYSIVTKGWPQFIAANNLQVGDVCVFKYHGLGTSYDGVAFDVEVNPRTV